MEKLRVKNYQVGFLYIPSPDDNDREKSRKEEFILYPRLEAIIMQMANWMRVRERQSH